MLTNVIESDIIIKSPHESEYDGQEVKAVNKLSERMKKLPLDIESKRCYDIKAAL